LTPQSKEGKIPDMNNRTKNKIKDAVTFWKVSKGGTIDITATTFPVVQFEYPDSNTNSMKLRYVRVTEANKDYVKGYELPTGTSEARGKFKQYSKKRITSNGVSLIKF
jgi:hypothetical protein